MEILVIVLLGGLIFAGFKIGKSRNKKPYYKSKYDGYKKTKNNWNRELKEKPENFIPWGEQLLIKELCRNFNLLGDEAVIWHGLEYKTEKSFRQVDFLVLCKKGLFVLESKYWKGISFIFDGEVVNLFEGTMYHGFGQANEETVKTATDGTFRAFNAQFNKEEGTMLLQTHQNPLVQVRNYARALVKILNNNNIKSVVVFSTNDKCELRYNRQPLNAIKNIDKYTSVLQNNQISDYFQSQAEILSEEEIEQIKSIVEKNLSYYKRIDKSNYVQEGQ